MAARDPIASLQNSIRSRPSSANRDTNQNYSYHIGDLIVPSVSCFTDIGVSYDELRFKPHIDQMVAKASLRAKLILKCFQFRDPKLLPTISVSL